MSTPLPCEPNGCDCWLWWRWWVGGGVVGVEVVEGMDGETYVFKSANQQRFRTKSTFMQACWSELVSSLL